MSIEIKEDEIIKINLEEKEENESNLNKINEEEEGLDYICKIQKQIIFLQNKFNVTNSIFSEEGDFHQNTNDNILKNLEKEK